MSTTPRNHTVLVTGASQGIGFATSQLLLERGFRVILLAADRTQLATAKSKLVRRGFAGDAIELAPIDLANARAIANRVPKLQLLQNGLFGLVNNAAVQVLKPLTDFSLEDLESMWRVNMRAPVLMLQACYPFLRAASGSVVNIGSISDRGHHAAYSIYGASKCFLNGFSLHAARELGFDGIRINVISPGGVNTPLMRKVERRVPRSQRARLMKSIPIEQRWAMSEEIAEAIYFCLTGPGYLHGADVRVHGGVE